MNSINKFKENIFLKFKFKNLIIKAQRQFLILTLFIIYNIYNNNTN